MTRKWYATLRHPKMHPHTKFGIPTSKNIGDMDRTRKRDGRTDGRTDGLTDGRTVRLLYASQSSFGGIKINFSKNIWHYVNHMPVLNQEILINPELSHACLCIRRCRAQSNNVIPVNISDEQPPHYICF